MNKLTFVIFTLFCVFILPDQLIAQIDNSRNVEYQWNTDTTKHTINLSELALIVPRNTFPTIDYPAFIGMEEGLTFFYKNEPVIVVAIKGKAKAYPLNMLTMHEISNDTLGGIPILPTYCPLCNASIVYDRRVEVNGNLQTMEFEVSGMLRKSDMVMADKQTESWWQQLTGEAIVGELTGTELTIIPSFVISVEMFFKSYPDGEILSTKTGTDSEERYGTNPYVGYDAIENDPYGRFFDPDSVDARLPAMERVVDIQGKNNASKIYPISIISKKGVLNDSFDGQNIVIFYKKGTVSVLDAQEISKSKAVGSTTVFSAVMDSLTLSFSKSGGDFIDAETESIWDITGKCISGSLEGMSLTPIVNSSHFAFAYLAFFPEAIIYGEE